MTKEASKQKPKRTRISYHDLGKRIEDLGEVRSILLNQGERLTIKNLCEAMQKKGYKNYSKMNLYRDNKDLMSRSRFIRDLTEFRLSYEVEDMFDKINEGIELAYSNMISDFENKKDSSRWWYALERMVLAKDKILNGDYVDLSYALAHEKFNRQKDELEEKDKHIKLLQEKLAKK